MRIIQIKEDIIISFNPNQANDQNISEDIKTLEYDSLD